MPLFPSVTSSGAFESPEVRAEIKKLAPTPDLSAYATRAELSGQIPIFATLAEAEAWEAANPGKQALTIEDVKVDTTGLATTTYVDQKVAGVAVDSWDADALAIARGFHEVLSATEPTEPSYLASNGQSYPVVWVRPIEVAVPVFPEEPYWRREDSTLTVADLVGVDYVITQVVKDGVTHAMDTKVTPVDPFDLTTLGHALPFTVTVVARPWPGYVLPSEAATTWSHDFPDPNATIVVTSDTFERADGTLSQSMSDAGLGGTPALWTSDKAAFRVIDGQAIGGYDQSQISIDSGALNMEAEFDIVRTDGSSDPIPVGSLAIHIGSNGSWESGYGIEAGGRTNIWNTQKSNWNTFGPNTPPGHYKLSLVGTTFSITPPNGGRFDFEVKERAEGATKFMLKTWKSASQIIGIDNLILRRVGF